MRRIWRLTTLAGLGLGMAIATSCGETVIGPPGGTASLRLLHASVGTGPIDLLIGNSLVIRDVAFGLGSPTTQVPAGSQRLVIRAGNQVLGEITGRLTTDHLNTVVVSNGSAHFTDVIPDTGAVHPERANLRLVNIAGSNTTEPTLLQAQITQTDPDSVLRIDFDSRVTRYGSLMYLPSAPGKATVKYVVEGGSTVLTQVSFPITAGQARAVVLERATNGTYSAQIVIER